MESKEISVKPRFFDWQRKLGDLFDRLFDSAERRRTKLILSFFRLAALAFAIIQIQFTAFQNHFGVPTWVIVLAACLYTEFKLLHPLTWYLSNKLNMALLALDITVCTALLVLSGISQSPFLLYSLSPVLTAAFLSRGKVTATVLIATFVSVILAFTFHPSLTAVEKGDQMTDFRLYLFALWLAAILPYNFNIHSGRSLVSKTKNEEQNRVRRDIHDGVCQQLYGLRLHVQILAQNLDDKRLVAREMNQVDHLVEETEDMVRDYLEYLSDDEYQDSFLKVLREHLEQLRCSSGIEWKIDAPVNVLKIDERVETELSRICLEALRNVEKHSQAQNVEVSLRLVKNRIQVKIKDDGNGLINNNEKRGHWGLAIMKKQTEELGGRLEVAGIPGHGTEVTVEVPQKMQVEIL